MGLYVHMVERIADQKQGAEEGLMASIHHEESQTVGR